MLSPCSKRLRNSTLASSVSQQHPRRNPLPSYYWWLTWLVSTSNTCLLCITNNILPVIATSRRISLTFHGLLLYVCMSFNTATTLVAMALNCPLVSTSHYTLEDNRSHSRSKNSSATYTSKNQSIFYYNLNAWSLNQRSSSSHQDDNAKRMTWNLQDCHDHICSYDEMQKDVLITSSSLSR